MNNNIKIALISVLLISSTILKAQEWSQIDKKLPVPIANNIDNLYGSSIAIDGDYAVVGAYGNNSSTGAVYVYFYNGTEWELQATLTASNGNQGDNFGLVAIDGDVIVVGAFGYNNNQGRAYIFEKPITGWADMTETSEMFLSNPQNDDMFSYVSISGNTIVVGAFGVNNYAGEAYVFEKTGATWPVTPTATLTPTDGADYNSFGVCTIEDDVIVIGAPDNANGVTYVYEKPGAVWADMTETARLTASDGIINDRFGNPVRIEGNNIVVGSMGANSEIGKVYVFEKTGTNWTTTTETAQLTASSGVTNDLFGSVDISGDNIIVGASGENTNIGTSYIFTKTGTTWLTSTETAVLTASDGNNIDAFGTCTAIDGDKIIIGASSDEVKGTNSGSIYTFNKPQTGGWVNATEAQKIYEPDFLSAKNNYFGSSVAIDGNYAVVGNKGWKNNLGCADVYYFDGTDWLYQATLTSYDSTGSNFFGAAVGINGDNIVVGAPYNNGGQVYVFEKPITGWENATETAILSDTSTSSSNKFGFAVDIFDDVIVVGDYKQNTIFVYKEPATGGWVNATETAQLTANVSQTNMQFGYSVDIDTNYIAVGAPFYDNNYNDEGAVYIFDKQTNWVNSNEDFLITDEGDLVLESDANFGLSVSLSGDILVSGVPYLGGWFSEEPKAMIFENNMGTWHLTANITSSDSPVYNFASSVSIYNNIIIVGNGEAYVYLYNKPTSGYWADTTETIKLYSTDYSIDFGSCIALNNEYLFIGSSANDNELGVNAGAMYIFKHCYSVDITSNILDAIVCENSDITISLQAEGESLTYQWQSFDGSVWNNIAGETNDSIVLQGVSSSFDTEYKCIVTGVCYSDTSNISNLTINAKPSAFSIIGQNTVDEFETVSYSVPFNSDLTYTWETTGGNIISMPSNNSSEIQWGSTGLGYIFVSAEDLNSCVSDTINLEVNIGNYVNINNIENTNISIYPNPATNQLTVDNEQLTIQNIQILDITGKIVKQLTIEQSNNITIDISDLSQGIYYLKMNNQVSKFVKE